MEKVWKRRRGSGCIEMFENAMQVWRVVSFIPPSPTQHISKHHNTLLKKVLLIAYFQQCLVLKTVVYVYRNEIAVLQYFCYLLDCKANRELTIYCHSVQGGAAWGIAI